MPQQSDPHDEDNAAPAKGSQQPAEHHPLDRPDDRPVRVSELSTAGIELGLVVAVLAIGGWWLDTKWGTAPWLLVTGAGIGILGGLYKFIRVSRRFVDRSDKRY